MPVVNDVLLYRPEEAATQLGISRSKCYQLIAQGVLPHLRVGRSLRVPAAALRRWIDDQEASAEATGGAVVIERSQP